MAVCRDVAEWRLYMRIAHIGMYVSELETTRDFFVRYFGAIAGEIRCNKKNGLRTCFVSFDDGTKVELMNLPQMDDRKKTLVRMGYIHIAISVGGRGKVDILTERLYEAGYEVLGGPRVNGDGYYESTVLGPEDNQIEIIE